MKSVETFAIGNIVGKSRKGQVTLDARHISTTGSFAEIEGADNVAALAEYRRLGQMALAEMNGKKASEVVRAVASYRKGRKLAKKDGGGFKTGTASLTTRIVCSGSKVQFSLNYQLHVARRQAAQVKAAAEEAEEAALMAAVAKAEAKGKAALAAKSSVPAANVPVAA